MSYKLEVGVKLIAQVFELPVSNEQLTGAVGSSINVLLEEMSQEKRIGSPFMCSSSQIAIKTEAPVGNDLSKTSTHLTPCADTESQRAIRTPPPNVEGADTSITEKNVDFSVKVQIPSKADLLAKMKLRKKKKSKSKSKKKGKKTAGDNSSVAIKTPPRDGRTDLSKTERVIDLKEAGDTEKAERTPRPDHGNEISKTERNVDDMEDGAKPSKSIRMPKRIKKDKKKKQKSKSKSKVKESVGKDKDKKSKSKKRSKDKKKKTSKRPKKVKEQPPIIQCAESSRAMRTEAPEGYKDISKTEKVIESENMEESTAFEKAIKTARKGPGPDISRTEVELDTETTDILPAFFEKRPPPQEVQVAPLLQKLKAQSTIPGEREAKSGCSFKEVAFAFVKMFLILIVVIYSLVFLSQIWRMANALVSLYDVSVDDCNVANSLCQRYSMCCFSQCGASRVQTFLSKLLG